MILDSEDTSSSETTRGRPDARGGYLAVVGPFSIALGAAAVGWALVQPGASMWLPLIAVTLTIAAPTFGLAWWLRRTRRENTRTRLVIVTAVLGACALVWTYFGVLPASIAWDTDAASGAQHALRTETTAGCYLESYESVGMLEAPVEMCVFPRQARRGMVRFTEADGPRGYAYLVADATNSGFFADECARHLVGPWWAVDSTGGPSCPFGYGRHSGG